MIITIMQIPVRRSGRQKPEAPIQADKFSLVYFSP